uniref:coiled-coil domain-containing protein 154 n=1 Tax=Jaculus jaculus TaxID=51337 RepID=UPI001E1B1296|nr:coiled-coil domain-containing protein 154 [Jaculus jaculus]
MADSSSPGLSPPSQQSTVSPEDLELLAEGLASAEPLSLEETSERCERDGRASSTSVPEQDTCKHQKQLEQWVAELQSEVVCLRAHKERCEHVTLGLLRELLQIHARVQLQDSELRQLRQAVRQVHWDPEKEQALEFPKSQSQNQMQALDKRLVEVREALTQIRRTQALQDSERKGVEQDTSLRLAKLTGLLRQEEQGRQVAFSTLQKSQNDTIEKVDHEVTKMQAQMTKLGEEMTLRFLKREAKLCGFLQKSFLALEQRMKALEGAQKKAESSLQEELECRWQKLQDLTEERLQALCAQREEEEVHLLEQCQGLDAAVVQLTKFVRQNQVSLNRVLLAEQKAREAKVSLEESQAGELASYVHENMEAVQLAGKQAQQETQDALELLQEKSQVLEGSVAGLAQQLKDLSDHCLALSWRLDLQEQTLGLKLSQAKAEWEGVERQSLQDLARWLKEVEAHLCEVKEKVDSLPQQIQSVADKCILHRNDVNLKISAECKARELEVVAVRQELATLVMSVQLLKDANPGRKIAEIRGQLATFQKQMIKLENSIQANKTIQNLKFNTETKLRTEEISSLRERVLRLCSEEGPWPLTPGSRHPLMSLVRQPFFIKDVAPSKLVPVNCWGVYQAVRWLQWKTILIKPVAQQRLGTISETSHQKPTHRLMSLTLSQK